jgi:hypothetical protein
VKDFKMNILAGALLAWSVAPLRVSAAGPPDVGITPVNVTVTISGPQQGRPSLTAQDLMVYQNNQRRPVLGVKPLSGVTQGTDLAILVDGSLSGELGLQFGDLKQFIRSLPSSTRVGVAYAEYGAAEFRQDFTTDHDAVVKAFRLPVGPSQAGASIFQSVDSLLKHWPADGRARSVLLISNGVDIYRGLRDTEAALNPDLQAAIDQAHKSGVTIYAVYAGGAAPLTQRRFLVSNGQDSLNRIANETGGQAYFEGFSSPIAFQPFLNDIQRHLGDQYVVTFGAATRHAPELARLRIATELPQVKITAPSQVWVPAAH